MIDAKLNSKKSNSTAHRSSESRSCLKSEKVLYFDHFGQQLQFNFHHGSSTFRSSSGSCISLLIGLITLVFVVQQSIVLYKRKATTFTSTNVAGYYDEDFTFGKD